MIRFLKRNVVTALRLPVALAADAVTLGKFGEGSYTKDVAEEHQRPAGLRRHCADEVGDLPGIRLRTRASADLQRVDAVACRHEPLDLLAVRKHVLDPAVAEGAADHDHVQVAAQHRWRLVARAGRRLVLKPPEQVVARR